MKHFMTSLTLSAGALLVVTPEMAVAQTTRQVSDCGERFYVRNNIAGTGLGLCETLSPADTASLSFTYDHQADESTGNADVAFGYRLGSIRTAGTSQFSTYAYAELDGNTGGANPQNEIRLGLYHEVMNMGLGAFNDGDLFLALGLSGFYVTDFDFDANGWGLSASITPIVNSDTFGVNYSGENGTPYMIARAGLDALWIEDGGSTGYADGSENARFTTTLGLGYASAPEASFPFDASLTYTYDLDLNGASDRNRIQARLSFPLAGSDNISTAIVYNRDEAEETGSINETTRLTLNFSF